MILCLSGPILGCPGRNFAAFDEAAKRLTAAGYAVQSPANMARRHGITAETPESEVAQARPFLLALCIKWIERTDAIALLPGWAASEGVALELHFARLIGRDALTVDEWIDRAQQMQGDRS